VIDSGSGGSGGSEPIQVREFSGIKGARGLVTERESFVSTACAALSRREGKSILVVDGFDVHHTLLAISDIAWTVR
jgi:hypothetical protein